MDKIFKGNIIQTYYEDCSTVIS